MDMNRHRHIHIVGPVTVEPALQMATPEDLLRWALSTYEDRLGLAMSAGKEDMVLFDMLARVDTRRMVTVFTLDTGRLHPETIAFLESIGSRYDWPIRWLHPDESATAAFEAEHGPDGIHRSIELRHRCCHLRKVEPLERVLQGLDAWMTGCRRDQTSTRSSLEKVAEDPDRDGRTLVKLNPLADWTAADVDRYLRDHDVPTHPLFALGFSSIGCAPCTRPTEPGQDPRAGRWWWEEDGVRECGLHRDQRA